MSPPAPTRPRPKAAPRSSSRPAPSRRPPPPAAARSRPGAAAPAPAPLSDDELDQLDRRLQALPPPLQPPGLSALDGYLVGVLLQPRPVPSAQWLSFVADVEGRPAPAGLDLRPLHALVLRRHAELDAAIAERDWFDPWLMVDEGDDDAPDDSAAAGEATADDAVLPWVAGFAAAMDRFPSLTAIEDPALLEPMALLYLHFDPDDLEDADELLALIETLEPPADLAEAVQDLVRAVMLMADVSRPLAAAGDAGAVAQGTARPRQGQAPATRPDAAQRPPGRRRP
jgi:uncharacterized protein